MTAQMHRISNKFRRLRRHRRRLFAIQTPTLDLTWADIMHDLDPDWHVGGWDATSQQGEIR